MAKANESIYLNQNFFPNHQNQSHSNKKVAIHDIDYPKQPDQFNQLEPSVRDLIQDNPSFRSFKQVKDSKQQYEKQQEDQPLKYYEKLNLNLHDSKSQRLFQSFTSFLEQNHQNTLRSSLKVNGEMIQLFISMVHLIFILIYIPIQYSYQLVQLNIYQIGYLIINMVLYFQIQQLITSKQVYDQYIQLTYFLKHIFLKDTLLIICLTINYFRITFEIDCLIITIIIHLSIGKLKNIWIRVCQFKLDFYFENILTLAFKTIIIINTFTCLNSLLVKNDHSDDSFIVSYMASAKISLSILALNYQGDQSQIEVCLISFFNIFVVVYLLHSFHIVLSEKGIEIHNFINSNNFDFVLREKLLNSIAKQRIDSKIHFPQRLSDQIKVNHRLPLLLRYFKGYDTSHLKDIAIQSEEIMYYPSEFIIKEDVPDDSSLYFLMDGYAEIQSSGFTLQSISAPDVFGEMSFYTQQPRLASVVSLTQCLILKVPRQVMIAGLGQTEKELFHEQKDQISLYSNLPIKCFCCKSNRHCIAQCNVFRIQINPAMIRSVSQTRCEYIRKQKKSSRIIPEQKKSKETWSPTKTEIQGNSIPFLYEQNKSEPLLYPASIVCEQKSIYTLNKLYFYNLSLNTYGNYNDQSQQRFTIEQYQQQKQQQKQKQNQFYSVQEEDEYEECSESFLNTNTLQSNFDVNPPVLNCESKISKISKICNNFGEYLTIILCPCQASKIKSHKFKQYIIVIFQDLQFMIIKDFDQCQLFKHYFPTGNFDNVIGYINQKL